MKNIMKDLFEHELAFAILMFVIGLGVLCVEIFF